MWKDKHHNIGCSGQEGVGIKDKYLGDWGIAGLGKWLTFHPGRAWGLGLLVSLVYNLVWES